MWVIAPLTILILFLISGSSFYAYWNMAPAEKTCASCHEIQNPVKVLLVSAHRKLSCKECHGTALSNGVHSLKEKSRMVFNHLNAEYVEDIRMNEEQVLDVMKNCVRCHPNEEAKWLSGGHSAKYRDIFLNKKHNSTEQLNFDCLRCHGMFSNVDINELVEPIDKIGPWKFKNSLIADRPAIPCLACHQIHQERNPGISPDYSNPKNAFYSRPVLASKVCFYNRHDRSGITAENLPVLKLRKGNLQVKVSEELSMRNCIQCHAPNAFHQTGTGDDRTPTGVHEGLPCNACHEPHSNDARKSCDNCHPAISNCKLDVKTMNTSYFDKNSPNNIHHVACTDCHQNKKFK